MPTWDWSKHNSGGRITAPVKVDMQYRHALRLRQIQMMLLEQSLNRKR